MEEIERVPALAECPTAPAPRITVYTRVLHRACEKVGGVEALASRLNAPVAMVYRWLEGEAVPPTAVFLKAVDIVMPAWTDLDEQRARALRAGRPKPTDQG